MPDVPSVTASPVIGACQACRSAPVTTTVENEDAPDYPFLLCDACARRFRNKALRPLEWYHLVILHGSGSYELCDSFYSAEGTAGQPDEPMEEPEKYPIPTLAQVEGDLEDLIDFAIAAASLDGPIRDALGCQDPATFLESIRRRMPGAAHSGNDVRLLEIGAVLGPAAADWIRECWQTWTPELLNALAEATASCLPLSEGFQRVTGVFDDEASRERILTSFLGRTRTYCYLLAPFRSSLTLDWMEARANLIDPQNPHWGRVAALSLFSWPRAKQWLARGMPLSLVALSALLACRRYDIGLLMQHRPVLLDTPPEEELLRVLDTYQHSDPTPEVAETIATIRKGFWQLGQAPGA